MRINYHKMTEEDKTMLIKKILKKRNGMFIFDGPSGSGKTMLLNELMAGKENTKIISDETFTERFVFEIRQTNKVSKAIKNMVQSLNAFSIIGIEDIDFQSGKPMTLEGIADIANSLSKKALLIFTGIDLEERTSILIERLKYPQFIYFYKDKKEG